MIKDLENEFTGTSSTKGFQYLKLESGEQGFLYQVTTWENGIHYEVFSKKLVPICIDFATHQYSDTDFKYVYPKDEDFGKWAWCIVDYNKAIEKFKSL